MKKTFLAIAVFLLFILILLKPDISIKGASYGLLLWYERVVPVLLPTMILSSILVKTNLILYPMRYLNRLLGPLLHTSECGSYSIITGLLCGYPMGAKTCADFIKKNQLSLEEAHYILPLVNHPSPMFISGFVLGISLPFLHKSLFLIAIYLPVLFFFILHRPQKRYRNSLALPPITFNSAMVDESIFFSVQIIVKIGIYMMYFSCIGFFCSHYASFLPHLDVLLTGICEMTTGISSLTTSTLPQNIIGGLACFFICFGGLSGSLQIHTALSGSGLSTGYSIRYAIFRGVIAAGLYILFCCFI